MPRTPAITFEDPLVAGDKFRQLTGIGFLLLVSQEIWDYVATVDGRPYYWRRSSEYAGLHAGETPTEGWATLKPCPHEPGKWNIAFTKPHRNRVALLQGIRALRS